MIEMKRTERAIAIGPGALRGRGDRAGPGLAGRAERRAPATDSSSPSSRSKSRDWQNAVTHSAIEAEDECEVSDHSFGREQVTFHTTKPIYVTATHLPGEFNPQMFGGPQLGIPVRARVQRSYTPLITGPAVACEENGGGAEPTKPDCGTKIVKRWRLNLQYGTDKKNGLLLSGNGDRDPYVNCPGASVEGFPWLLVEGSGHQGKYIYADVSQDELFDPKFQKWISIANGTAKNSGKTWWSKTDVHWEVSFTRLKPKRTGR